METKNLYENGSNTFFYSGPKVWSESNLWQRFCFGMVSTASLSFCLCGGDTRMKLPNENSHQVFETMRVRYARADELELYSSSTTSPVKRRHQLMLRFYSCSRIVGG